MPIKQLTEEQVRTWSREQKDRWWLDNVWRGDMPQLTLRAAITGFVLGGVLSATNLYVGAKTGWTLGVGLTSVILAFAMFRIMSRVGFNDMTILENNAMQSIATSAGYMTSPLVAGFAAYMWVTNKVVPGWHMFWFMVVMSVLGVLVAFPLKRRFINDEQQPFPEGKACGVVLDALYTSAAAAGMFKAKLLAAFAGGAGFITFLMGESYSKFIHAGWLYLKNGMGGASSWTEFVEANKDALDKTWHLPHNCDGLYAWMASRGIEPRLSGVTFKQLAINPALELSMIGAGALMGIKAATSLMIGMVLNFFVIVPWMISLGEIAPKSGSIANGDAVFGRAHILNTWALWYGIVLMVVASLVALFAKPKILLDAFGSILVFTKKEKKEDILRDIELPLWISFVGVPIVGAIGVYLAHEFFGVSWWFGASAIAMICLLTLIAASSTAMTGTTPTGSLSKIPQFTYGALDPTHPATNLMTGVMCTEVAGNASNLLMDIKPGYMLGAKPRQQAIGHCIGIIAGCAAATPLFNTLFLSDYEPGTGQKLQDIMAPEGGQFTFPGAVQWKGVSDLVTEIFGGGGASGGGTLLTQSIIISMVIALVVAFVFESLRIITRGKWPISPLAMGLGVVVPADSTMMMFLGALFFWFMHKLYAERKNTTGHRLWVDSHEPICAGIIAGAALVGIGDILVKVFLL